MPGQCTRTKTACLVFARAESESLTGVYAHMLLYMLQLARLRMFCSGAASGEGAERVEPVVGENGEQLVERTFIYVFVR